MSSPSPDQLLGRDDQWQALAAVLADPCRPARSVLLEGEAGIGKTVLVRAALREGMRLGYRVLAASPVEAEADLAWTGLGDLIEDVLPMFLAELPEPQRIALEVALLVRDDAGHPPGQRAIGLALLHGLRALATEVPVLLAIDDAHWLDVSSAEVLRFALRRLRAEPVVTLLAGRPSMRDRPHGLDGQGLPSVERVELGPLSLGAIHALVGERLGSGLSRPSLRRIHELSRGNPFFALELARGAHDGALDPRYGGSLSPDLDALVGQRIRSLPVATRQVLAVAAAATSPSRTLVADATDGVDVAAALEPAIGSGIVRLEDDTVVFTHPLLASGALATLDGASRRACHARLARAVDDPVERARHLALAASGHDPAVAVQVEQAALLTRARGATSGAADLMALALRLTPPDDTSLGTRRLLEAELRLEAGDAPGAAALLERLVGDTPAGPRRAVPLARLARLRQLASDTGGGVGLLRQALLEAGPSDPVRGEVHEALAWALILVRHDLPAAHEHARAAVAVAKDHDDPPALAQALSAEALTRTLLGLPDGGAMERAVSIEGAASGHRVLRGAAFAQGYQLVCLDALDEADATYAGLLARAESQGDESAPGHILGRWAVVRMHQGDLAAAERMAAQAVELSGQTGQVPTQASAMGRLALILARRGDLDRAAELAGQGLALASAQPTSDGGPVSGEPWWSRPHARGGEFPLWALGHVALCREAADEAATWFTTLSEPVIESGVRQPGDLRWLLDEVEALVLANRVAEAEARARLMEEMGTVGRPWAIAVARAARGILDATDRRLDAAASELEAAATQAEQAPLPFERARILLLLGRVQRRLARKREARATLSRAAAVFEAMGARHWAGVCHRELGRIGGRSAGGSELTDSERHVVELVAQGLSNKEVASALFVTPKAVEASLSRIYAKLGVRSRTELVSRLPIDAIGTAADTDLEPLASRSP